MPSPPLRLWTKAVARGQLGRRLASILLGALLLVHCGGGAPPVAPRPVVPSPPVAELDRPFLLDPFDGYQPAADSARVTTVQGAHRQLMATSEAHGAETIARELLVEDPGFEPAKVLLAQAFFVAERYDAVVLELSSLLEAQPGYLAARLVVGRSHERLGDLVAAYSTYRADPDGSPAGAQRVEELRPRVLEIMGRRLSDRLAKGDTEGAVEVVSWLERWEPTVASTHDAQRELAVARRDLGDELAALRLLTPSWPDRTDLVRRRADLELELGDAGQAVELYRSLTETQGDSTELRQRLEQAKFRWRLSLLPEAVRVQADRPALSRAGFATLLYWLIPEVRYGRPAGARIASDILGHPSRDEIARVVNLGLMELDSTLHAFHPGSGMTRPQALRAVLAAAGLAKPLRDCLEPSAASPCEIAVRCGLVSDIEACQARQNVSGREAVAMIEKLVAQP